MCILVPFVLYIIIVFSIYYIYHIKSSDDDTHNNILILPDCFLVEGRSLTAKKP